MKSLYLAILFIAINSILAEDTVSYKCASELKLDTCYLKDVIEGTDSKTITYYVDACGKGKKCEEKTGSSITSQCSKVKYLLLEGDKCTAPSECYSGKCDGEKCAVISDGGKCSDIKECAIGSYCAGSGDDKTCKKYLAKDADCSQDNEGCRPGLTCVNDKCIPLFSLANGEKANNDNGCKSYYTFNNNNEEQCGEVKSVPSCTAGSTVDAVIDFGTDVTVKCNCEGGSGGDYGCSYLSGILENQDAWNKYAEEFAKHADDIIEDDDYLEIAKLSGDSNAFGIKKLREKYVEYRYYDKISQAPTDDDKDCVRDYYARQLSSNKLYMNIFGIALLALVLF